MQDTITFNLETTTYFGAYSYKKLPDIIRKNFWQRIGLVIDKGVINTAPVKDLISQFKEKTDLFLFEARNTEEPDYDYLEKCRREFTSKLFDCLVGIGGGSTLDLTKAIAVLLTNSARAIDYRGFDLVKNPGIPVIAISTTAGTGSEITPYAVFIDKKEMRKLGINGRYIRAKLAILDPVFTLSCPHKVTLSSGMDALTHTLESYVAKNANIVSRLFSKEAFKLIFNNLHKVIDNTEDLDSRSKMLLGSFYAGIALMNSGAGPAGALSYPLGLHYKVAHGIAGAVFLPHLVEFNVNNGYHGYAGLYELIDNSDSGLNPEEKSKEFVRRLFDLAYKIGVPKTLKEFGVSKNDVDLFADSAMSQLKAALEENPVSFGRQDTIALISKLTA